MIQPLDQVRSIVASAFNPDAKIRKNFKSFIIETMILILILTIYGKLNFLQLGRHSKHCESRFRQNFKKEFDWCGFNMNMCHPKEGVRGAVALDHSFLSKSGKKTPGLGWYWSGCAGSVKRGLEILGFAYVVPGEADARFLFAEQSISVAKRGRTPHYLEHMKDKRDGQTARCLRAVNDKRDQLMQLTDVIVGDCLFATYNMVTGLRAIGFHVVSRFRDDAVLQYLYTGPQKPGRGRKKELDGPVDIDNLRQDVFVTESVEVDGEAILLHSAVVKSKSLKRKVRVVIAELRNGNKTIRKIFFSTDTTMTASEIFLIYHSRFQIEFLFRDAKQNTGLEDWQSTDADRLSFGYNASLTAVNVAREYAKEIHKTTGRKLSVASVKKVLHNAALYQHIKEFIEGSNSADPKNNSTLSDEVMSNLLFFGVRDSA